MQAKNIILFIVLSVAILVGWTMLQQQLWPVKPPREKPKEEAKKEPKKKDVKKKNEEPPKKDDKDKTPPRPAVTASPRVTGERITLGQDRTKYHIRLTLTTLGGAVEGLTLTKFNGADEDGKDTGDLLHLIPRDPVYPSYVLYHYQQPEPDKNNRPLDALGVRKWEIVRKNGARVVTDRNGVQEVTFKAKVKVSGKPVSIYKTYRLAPGEYHVGLSVRIKDERPENGRDKKPLLFRYQLTGGHGLPIEGRWYTSTFRNALIGLVDPKSNLERAVEDSRKISIEANGDRVPPGRLGNDRIQYAGVVTQFFASMIVADNAEGSTIPPGFLEWARPTVEMRHVKGRVIDVDRDRKGFRFFDSDGKQFYHFDLVDTALLDKLKTDQLVYVSYRPGTVIETVEKHGGKDRDVKRTTAYAVQPADETPQPQFDDVTVRVNTERLSLLPGEAVVHNYLLYNGPVKVRLLGQFTGAKAVNASLVNRYENDLHLNTLTDYHSDNWFGRFAATIHWTDLLIACTNLMHWLLGVLHSVVPIYGLCIILLTVMVRGLMFPISRKQAYLSMKMQELAPELKKIQEKHKADPQAKTQAMMELYRRHGVNPLAGCLPLLLQMPIFLGLYYALQESIFFRLAPFVWIDNLAAPDMLIHWGPNIPLVSGILGPYFNLLPVLAVALMLAQQKMMTPPPTDETQASQQRIMKIMMVFIGFMFYKVAAGLCIYFIASSLWGLAERKLLPRRKAAALPPAAPSGPAKPAARGPAGSPKTKKAAKPTKNADGTFQKVRDWWADVLKQAKKK
jgi:YidC/Oxa1 family membrane protein insertase